MEWVSLSLASAFFLATSDALAKKAVADENEYLVAWSRLVFTLPALIAAFFFVPIPDLDADFYRAFFIALPIELVTIILYIKALKASPLSLTLPFLALTPVFLIVVSYLLLGETVSVEGGIGIMLIAAGGYMLNLKEARKGVFGPCKAIMREKGSLFMIAVALLYSITSSLGKMAIEHSSPVFFGATYFIALNIAYVPIGLYMGRNDMQEFFRGKRHIRLLLPGLFYGLMVIAHMEAISLTRVAYMISVKRTSLLMGVLYGYFLFREENIRERFAGALLMLAGFVIVVTAA